jgi:hypothetical protein
MDVANECMVDVTDAQLMAMACPCRSKQAKEVGVAKVRVGYSKGRVEEEKSSVEIPARRGIQSSGWRRSRKGTRYQHFQR